MRNVKTIWGQDLIITTISEARKDPFAFKFAEYPLRAKKTFYGYGVFGKRGWNVLISKFIPESKSATLKVASQLAKLWNNEKEK